MNYYKDNLFLLRSIVKSKFNKGFSLIELSIVLIIMGLLVAGVTGGASLIKSAELRSLMTELRNYQTGVNAYYTSTGYLPESESSDQMDFAKSKCAFEQMVSEGILDISFKSSSASSSDPEDPESASSSSSGCSTLASFNEDSGPTSRLKGGYYAMGYNDFMKNNVIFLYAVGATADTPTSLKSASDSNTVNNPSLTRKDSKFLDDKLDDGVIDSGKFRTFKAGSSSACAYSSTDQTKDCASAYSIGL